MGGKGASKRAPAPASAGGGGERRKFVTDKYRWEVKNNLLSGIVLGPLLQIFVRYRKDIAWVYYAHRVFFLVAMACVNTFFSVLEDLLYSRAIERVELHPRPVFILGHPRTGTTHVVSSIVCDWPPRCS